MKRFVSSEIRINAPARDIIKALIDPEDLRQWWGVDNAFVQPRDNGLYTLTWMTGKEGIKFISTGRIRLLNKRSHLELEDLLYINSEKGIIGPCVLKYETEENQAYSILKVTHSGFEKGGKWDWYYEAVKDGWPEALVLLKKYLEK